MKAKFMLKLRNMTLHKAINKKEMKLRELKPLLIL